MSKNIASAVIFICVFFTFHLKAETSSTISLSPLIPPFTANYNITRNNDYIGKGVRELHYITPELAQYSYNTDLEWYIFSDKRSESSTVMIKNSHLTPTHYRYTREGTGPDKAYEWTYDIANNQATNVLEKKAHKKIKTIAFPKEIQDKLSYHLQNRLNLITTPETKRFVYPVLSTSGSIKNYEYEFDCEEDLMLPYGLVKSVRYKRVVAEKAKITYVWFAPEHQYLLVKLRLEKGGVEQFQAVLDSYTIKEDI